MDVGLSHRTVDQITVLLDIRMAGVLAEALDVALQHTDEFLMTVDTVTIKRLQALITGLGATVDTAINREAERMANPQKAIAPSPLEDRDRREADW